MIVARDLSFAIGGRPVIQDLSLELGERRIGVVGPNGSGKSTLARLVTGLAAPDAGTLTVEGVEVADDRKAAIRTVGIIFQNPDHQIIFPTVAEEIGFGLTQLGETRTAAAGGARAMLARFGHEDWLDRPVHTLSQGQRHLVAILAVLVMEPAWIVLDEPFAGLDIPTARRLHRFLDGLEQRLLVISHDPAALDGFDRVLWLDGGRVREDGPARPVLAAFRREMDRLGEGDAFADLAG